MLVVVKAVVAPGDWFRDVPVTELYEVQDLKRVGRLLLGQRPGDVGNLRFHHWVPFVPVCSGYGSAVAAIIWEGFAEGAVGDESFDRRGDAAPGYWLDGLLGPGAWAVLPVAEIVAAHAA